MTLHPAVVRHIPGRAQEDPAEMHQLGKGEIRQETGNQEQMGVEYRGDVRCDFRLERGQPHSQLLDGDDVHAAAQVVTHGDTGDHNTEQEKKREVVIGQGDVAYRTKEEAPEEKSRQTEEDQDICNIH